MKIATFPLLGLAFTLSIISLPVLAATDMVSVESLAPSHQFPATPKIPSKTKQFKLLAKADPMPSPAIKQNSDFTKEDTQRQLAHLMQAQQAMLQQIEILKARVEKTESQTNANAEDINSVKDDADAQNASIQSLTKRVKITGYVESGWRLFGHAPRTSEFLDANGKSGNTFSLRRVVLRPQVQFNDKAGWFSEVEFEDAGLDETVVEQSEFYYNHKPWLNFKAGIVVPPLTQTAYLHEGTSRLLVDRPLVDQIVVPSTYQDLGIGINGTVPLFKQSAFKYDLMVLNGFKDTIGTNAAPGQKVSRGIDYFGLHDLKPAEGSSHFLDNNGDKAIFGRLAFLPLPWIEAGVGVHSGNIDNSSRHRLTLLTGDLKLKYKRFGFLAEYANALFNRGDGINSQGIAFNLFPASVNGFFIQPSYEITPKLTAVAGVNYVNLDTSVNGNKLWRFSGGLRYKLLDRVFLKTEYQLTTRRELFPEERYGSALLTELTFDF